MNQLNSEAAEWVAENVMPMVQDYAQTMQEAVYKMACDTFKAGADWAWDEEEFR